MKYEFPRLWLKQQPKVYGRRCFALMHPNGRPHHCFTVVEGELYAASKDYEPSYKLFAPQIYILGLEEKTHGI